MKYYYSAAILIFLFLINNGYCVVNYHQNPNLRKNGNGPTIQQVVNNYLGHYINNNNYYVDVLNGWHSSHSDGNTHVTVRLYNNNTGAHIKTYHLT